MYKLIIIIIIIIIIIKVIILNKIKFYKYSFCGPPVGEVR